MLKRIVPLVLIFSLLLPAFAQKKNDTVHGKSLTTTKSAEAKKAIDKLKKNPNPKKEEPVIVYNEDFLKGEELFQLNRPKSAITYFEKALEAENVDPKVYIYLGVCYYQIEEYDKSLAISIQGMAKEGSDKKILAYNAGNTCYAMGNYMRADASYAISLKEDEKYSPAILNRANAQLKLDHLGDARENYVRYLELEPETDQKEKIEEIIRLLDEEIARRANEKPELINPDAIVENEKMTVPDPVEKVFVDLPVEEKPQVISKELVKDEARAPKLPENPVKKDEGEKVTDSSLVSSESEKNTPEDKALPRQEKTLSQSEQIPAEKITLPEISVPSQKQTPLPVISGFGSAQKSERVYDTEEQARFAEENRLALEAEKARLAEESKMALEKEKARLQEEAQKKAEAEAARLAVEEAERRRNDDMRLILEVEKARLAAEAQKALEVEKARLAEEARKSLELEKARLEAEAARDALEAEKARLQEEAKRQLEAEKARLAEEAKRQLEEEKARIAAEEERKAEEAKKTEP